jgi:KH domain
LLSDPVRCAVHQVVQEGVHSIFNAVSQSIECPVDMVGKVIGKHGQTLRDLQHIGLGVQIDLDSSVPRDDPTPRLSEYLY